MIRRFCIPLLLSLALLVPGVALSIQPAHAAPVIAANDTNDQNKKSDSGNKQTENQQNGPLQNAQGENRDPVSENVVKDTSVVEYISDAYGWLSIIGGLLAVIMLIYAGYSYMSSNGDPEKISNSKDIVEKALLGLALLILATVILKTINPRTVDPCQPGDPGCGTVDFTQPDGGVSKDPKK
jgi:uncharacterized membrane protein